MEHQHVSVYWARGLKTGWRPVFQKKVCPLFCRKPAYEIITVEIVARPRRIELRHAAFESLATRLEAERKVLGYAAESCRTYYLQAVEFLAWLESRNVLDIGEVKPVTIREYYAYVATRPGANGEGSLSEKAIGAHVRVVRDLFGMLLKTGELKVDPTSAVRWQMASNPNAAERESLTMQEVEKLYSAASTAREKAILSLAYGCGLRVGEMVRLNVADVRLRDELLVVQRGKGGKRRTVPLSEGVAEDLREYMYRDRGWWLKLGDSQTPALVVGDRGRRMQKWTYNKQLRELGERAELEVNLSCHKLRHAIATHLLERGLTMQQVQQFLGHKHLETTQVYTHVSGSMLKDLIE